MAEHTRHEARALPDDHLIAPGQPCDRCARPRAKPNAADDDFLCFAWEGAGYMAFDDCAEHQLERLREEVPACRRERDSYKADAESAAETIAALREQLRHLESQAEMWRAEGESPVTMVATLRTPRPRSEWHEDMGAVLWWFFPIQEPPYVGGELDASFPDYVTHWTPLPEPFEPKQKASG